MPVASTSPWPERIMTSHRLEQPLAREDAAGIFEEVLEQPKFGRAERDRIAAAPHPMRSDIHLKVGINELLASERGPDTTEDGADAGDELARAERLGHIIVGAGVETADAVALLATRCQHHDRDVGRGRAAAQATADLDPADALDHPVEQDHVRLDLVDQDQGFLAVAGAGYVIAGALEMKGDEIGEGAIVFDK